MPTVRISLAGSSTLRNINPDATITAAKDQRFLNCMAEVISNSITGKRTYHVNKRPGFKDAGTIASGKTGLGICDAFGFTVMGGPLMAFSDLSGTFTINIYNTVAAQSIGTIGPTLIKAVHITQARINDVETYLISAAGSGYYYGTSAVAGTFTADTTSGNATLANVSSTTGLVVGQLLTGTGIASGARIQSIGAGSLVMTENATANGTGVTITNEALSKIIDGDFPQIVGPMIEKDGYVFAASAGSPRSIYHSDINNLQSWSPSSYITPSATPGLLQGISRHGEYIVAHVNDSVQWYRNAGNQSGSVLSLMPDMTMRFGTLRTSGESVPYSFVDDLTAVLHNGVHLIQSSNGIRKVSTPVIDKLIANVTETTVVVDAFDFNGAYFVYVADTGGTFSLLYDVQNNWWHESGFSAMPRFSKKLHQCVYRTPVLDGKLHYFPWVGTAQTPTYQDDGSSFTMTIQTGRIDHGTDKRKFIKSVRLIADQQASGTATLASNDNDYDSGSWVTLGTFDMTKQEKRINRCGSHNGGRAYRLTHSANTAFRAEALEITYSEGTG